MVLASVFLLLVTSISAPERSDVAILQIDVIQRAEIRNATVNLGGWGYCVNDLRRKYNSHLPTSILELHSTNNCLEASRLAFVTVVSATMQRRLSNPH